MNTAITEVEKTSLAAARRAEREGRFSEAEAAYAAIVAEVPASIAAIGLVRMLDRRGERADALKQLLAFVGHEPGSAGAMAAARQLEIWESSPVAGALEIRIAVTGAGTLAPVGSHLRVACARAGLHAVVHVGGFNQWAQDLLNPTSDLHTFRPEVILVLVPADFLLPTATTEIEPSTELFAQERAAALERIRVLLEAAALHSPGATVVLSNFVVPDRAPLGILDASLENGQRSCLASLNDGLAELVRQRNNVVLFDQERLEARFGKSRVRDTRLWYLGSVPFSEPFQQALATEYLRIIRPLKGLSRKVLVLDLDNTLWGGVIGEDGVNGIKLGGNDAPGNAFADFQQGIEHLRRRGILLAICSRNNPDDVWPVLDSHPDMLLRRDRFAAWRINWNDKATNLRELAAELNVGLDSFVFFDDNPAERELVRHRLPEVLTVDVPRDPAFYLETLLALDVFETLRLTDEDRARSDMYRQAQARRAVTEKASDSDLGSHLEELQIEVTIDSASDYSIPRIAQLVNKTNQFNLTTRRYTEAQIREMATSENAARIYSVSVSDRFGDLGLTGVAIVQSSDAVVTIDSFLLSCRVLGRGVEDALLGHIVSTARRGGATVVKARFVPTAKNEPARGFYERSGFRPTADPEGGPGVLFVLDLAEVTAIERMPDWLRIRAQLPDNLG